NRRRRRRRAHARGGGRDQFHGRDHQRGRGRAGQSADEGRIAHGSRKLEQPGRAAGTPDAQLGAPYPAGRTGGKDRSRDGRERARGGARVPRAGAARGPRAGPGGGIERRVMARQRSCPRGGVGGGGKLGRPTRGGGGPASPFPSSDRRLTAAYMAFFRTVSL